MTPEEKEAYRLFWMVKGHLKATHNTVIESYNGYFKRIWYNEEAYHAEEGFEQAFNERIDNDLD